MNVTRPAAEVQPRANKFAATTTRVRAMFVDLERIAGVEHRRGRSFYGLRRQAIDLAPEFSQDAGA